MTTKTIDYLPVLDPSDGSIQLYDIYVKGLWIGSRRLLRYCEEEVRCYAIRQKRPSTKKRQK